MAVVFHSATSRGYANHGWLEANHSFSFARFIDRTKMNFGKLRVLNDDRVAPGMGFGTHPHDNMEIITIPLSGTLKHKDSMDDQWKTVETGEVQVMSAGTGIYHSEMNASSEEDLTLFQIWIIPDRLGVVPRYEQHRFSSAYVGKLQVLVESIYDFSKEDSLKIYQNATISRVQLHAGDSFKYDLKSKLHGVYIMQVSGEAKILEMTLSSRDALGVWDSATVEIDVVNDSDLLFIEVPM